jgi:prepilin-type N-terminal cleavage/methylation domain-containing protein
MFTHRHSRGFTLVELVVVIAIIGLLVSVVSVNLSASRAKARDAQRLTQLEQIHLAVEAYREAYGTYPLSCNGDGEWGGHGSAQGNCADYIDGIENIVDLPTDPSNTTDGFRYISDGASYRIESYNAVENNEVGTDHEYAACDDSCSTGLCAASGGEYTTEATSKTYAVWSGTTYQCTQASY